MNRLFEIVTHRKTNGPVLLCRKVFATVFAVTFLLSMLTAYSSCDCEQPEMAIGEGKVVLTLHLTLPGKKENTETRAITANEESAIDIKQLKILMFKVVGSTETFSYEAPQVKQEGGKYIVTLKQSQSGESYRLVVIANAKEKLPYIPEGSSKADALKMITFDSKGIWKMNSSTDYTPIPMWGEATTPQVITSTTTLGSITLLRALARIDVGCALSGETAAGLANFTLKSVSVYRTRDKGYVAPVNGGAITNNVVTSVSIPTDAEVNNALTYTCTDDKSLIRAIYVSEVAQGSNNSNNVCLVIGGIYNGSLNYYRVDMKGSDSSYLPLKRNCRYILNIKTVSNAGYTTEAKALEDTKTIIIETISANAWATEGQTSDGNIVIS